MLGFVFLSLPETCTPSLAINIIIIMTIQELEDFFRTHPVPKGTMLNVSTIITEPEKFLEVNLDVVREWPRELNKCPSYWHLCHLAAVISDTGIPAGEQ